MLGFYYHVRNKLQCKTRRLELQLLVEWLIHRKCIWNYSSNKQFKLFLSRNWKKKITNSNFSNVCTIILNSISGVRLLVGKTSAFKMPTWILGRRIFHNVLTFFKPNSYLTWHIVIIYFSWKIKALLCLSDAFLPPLPPVSPLCQTPILPYLSLLALAC